MTTQSVIRTVLGDVPADTVGHIQPHEHVLCDLSRPLPPDATPEQRAWDTAPITLRNYYEVRREHTSEDLRLDDVSIAIAELTEYREAGGSAVVDATSIGLHRDPQGLAAVSQGSGVHIIMGCGYYYREYHEPDFLDGRSREQLAADMVGDIMNGAGGTSIRAGVIGEIGLSWPHHPVELRVLEAAVDAQLTTGAGLLIHPARHEHSPLSAVKVVRAAGGDVSRTIISHVERTLFDRDQFRALADTGCYVEFDLFGQESSYYSLAPIDMPNDAMRVDYIIDLVERGHLAQILISQDICHKTNLHTYGGEGYVHILRRIIPLMLRKGLTEEQVYTITVANPRRALAMKV